MKNTFSTIRSRKVTLKNFHVDTFANFTKIKKSELPNRKPDFKSKSGSKYWYERDKVYRHSDHWGRTIASCNWLIDGNALKKETQGVCYLSDFKRQFIWKLDEEKYVGKPFEVCKTVLNRKGAGSISIEILKGRYVKKTQSYYVFDSFKVAKDTIAYIEPITVIRKRGGRISPSATPAPASERIFGSKNNKRNSASTLRSAKSIVLSQKVIEMLREKADNFNSKNAPVKVTLPALKAVMRRGMGAYSVSHRPTIRGGKPNSRTAWGTARVNAFLYKLQNGYAKNKSYVQDDDLIAELKTLKKGGAVNRMSIMPDKRILSYGEKLKTKSPETWKKGGNIFGNKAFVKLKTVSNRGYWLESERWMYNKWQSFIKRHQHNKRLPGIIANIKWASWGNIGEKRAKKIIDENIKQ